MSVITRAEVLAGTSVDTKQSAIALDQDLVLVTRNSRDFKDGQPVRVLIPYGGEVN